ncbi:response regulator transcription factor [Propioniciclava coleopterorum]|uniref:Response regulator transcription factor n=1 Tax=Propioniciclava coleopterorum TaxID=2714937 RepID=A0A6G7Y5S0_9ACTN|nr:response regulator transcription factor [Propioniciclava coleopterorum]QIK71971.1 response regulator transcription factor [Propioniciclava coleopterorum]
MTTATQAPPVRILLADDLLLFRRAIAELIDDQEDLSVIGQADNGVEAVEMAQALRPDIVVLDVEMPVMDGIAAARRIRELLPETRIVMLTVWQDDDHLLEAIQLGVHGYLLKDLRPDELYAMLRSVMRDETPVSPALVGRLLTALRESGRRTVVPEPEQAQLSRRELEVLRLVADGLSNKEIGANLCITEGTVKNHVHNALAKLGMENRIQAAAYIVRQGLGLPRR